MHHGKANELNLVAIGDSQTATRTFATGGATIDQTYVSRIAKARGYANFWNAGVGGDTTTAMLSRFAADVLAHHAGAVSIMGGVNDMGSNVSGTTWTGAGISLATTKANLKSMVQQAQAARSRVTLCSWFPFRSEPYLTQYTASGYDTMLTQIVSETGCEFFDVYSRFIAYSSATLDGLYVSGDSQHPNYLGHADLVTMATDGSHDSAFAQF